MAARTFVIGTRGSRLALQQVEIVLALLRQSSPDARFAVREIKTEGDSSSAPLSEIGGLGVFTKAIEDALLAGECDIAVHSLKDLPPQLTPGLTLAAIPPRADPRDALVTRDGITLESLPADATVGTGSARRAAQLRALRPDIKTAEIRGNVDTRVAKVDAGAYDGAVLALAGLERLGLAPRVQHIFTVDEMVPSVGQGALGVELRVDDAAAIAAVSPIDNGDVRAAVTAERACLERLGAGCRMPVGALGRVTGDRLEIVGMMARDEASALGGAIARATLSGRVEDARGLGAELADELMARLGGARA